MNEAPAPHRDWLRRRTVLGVFLFFLGLFCLTNPGTINAVDTWRSVGEAAAIVELGQLDAEGLDPAVVGVKAERAIQPVPGVPRGVNKYGFALNLGYVPAYLAAKFGAAVTGSKPLDVAPFTFAFVNPLAGALFCALLLGVLAQLGFSRRVALCTTFAVGLGTFLWPTTGLSYSDPQQATALAGVLFAALRARRLQTSGSLHLLGAACVLSVLTKTANAPLTATFALISIPDRRALGPVVLRLAPWAILTAGLYGTISWARYGNPFASGYRETLFGHTPVLVGLETLFLSTDRGLVWFVPLLPVALFGLFLFRARAKGTQRGVGSLLWIALPVHLAVYVTFQDVHGGHCLGPRYLLVLLPVLAVGLATVLRSVPTRQQLRVAVVSIALTGAWIAPLTIVQYFQYEALLAATRHRGLTTNRPIVPWATAQLLAAKSVAGPDTLPLAPFTSTPTTATHTLSDWDNSGWQWWWIKPHPRLPVGLRAVGALVLLSFVGTGLGLLARERSGATRTEQIDASDT